MDFSVVIAARISRALALSPAEIVSFAGIGIAAGAGAAEGMNCGGATVEECGCPLVCGGWPSKSPGGLIRAV
jgi:hypothetical protein